MIKAVLFKCFYVVVRDLIFVIYVTNHVLTCKAQSAQLHSVGENHGVAQAS